MSTLLSLSALAVCSASAITLNGPTNLAVGPNPDGIAIGKFNNDAFMDIAVSVDGPDRVQIYFGSLAGTFTLGHQVFLGAGVGAGDLRAMDADGDADTDLIVAQHNAGSARVLINPGSGLFTVGSSVATGSDPRGLSTGDINGDNQLDAAVANRDGNSVTQIKNSGAGNFASTTFGVGVEPQAVALGDINGDGRADGVVSNHRDRTIQVMLSSGGNLAAGATYSVGGAVRPNGVAIADIDGDLDQDVLVAVGDPEFLSVFRNNGAGVLSGPTNYATLGLNGDSVATGDLDGDGDTDVALTNQDSNQLSVFENLGTGTFAAAQTHATGTRPGAVRVSDINGDGALDLAVSNRDSSNVSLYFGVPSGPIIVTPSAFSFLRGAQAGGNLASLQASDDDRLGGKQFVILNSTEAPVQVQFDGTVALGTVSRLTLKYEGSTSVANMSQTLSLFDFSTGAYEVVDTRAASLGDSTVTVIVTTNPGRFVSSTGALRALVGYKPTGPVLFSGWQTRTDYVQWEIQR
ncbi:MAG: VCBS repeat-containing protein [Fimbriimonadaceae bacterium]|nr:VCBS repeat-containing protein [Fimbriimonadaceae bacterium]